jgi:hypothetical protein
VLQQEAVPTGLTPPQEVTSVDTVGELITSAATLIKSLAFIPINPAYEATVDRLIKDRLARGKSRALKR